MNRRQFMQGTAGTAICLGSLWLPIKHHPSLHCGRCGAPHRAPSGLLLSLLREPVRYCTNCGVDLTTLKHNLPCHEYLQCLARDAAMCHQDQPEQGTCFRIPFPKGKNLPGHNRSTFSLTSLNF